MLKKTSFALGNGRAYGLKYHGVVSYNKLPWRMLAADTPELHMNATGNYTQLLKLATTSNVPNLLNDFHLEIPKEQMLTTLPSTLYIIPGIASAMGNDPAEYGPYGWSFAHVTDSLALQYYASVEAAVGTTISDVITFKSPDLRIICNAVVFRPGAKLDYSPNSTFAQMASAAGEESKAGSSSDAASTLPDFVLFHFFRPNRPLSELSVPLQKYFRHPLAAPSAKVAASSNGAEVFGLSTRWEPTLDQPNAAKHSKLTPAKAFRPPTSYLPGLYERLAIKPGDAYGKRSLMWGSYF